MVMDFRDLKPIIRKICKELDGKMIIPNDNKFIKFNDYD
jgi:6-pyruvoyl-tetrahydropterin synthase